MCLEYTVQFLCLQVALISEHVEMHVHGFLVSVGDAENVDASWADGQGFRQEVPERLQPSPPLHVGVDKLSGCNPFNRQRERRLMT